MLKLTIKDYYAGFAIIVATVLAFCGTFLPPAGIVDSSMLYLIAQFLVLAATLLGFGTMYTQIYNMIKGFKNNQSKEEA